MISTSNILVLAALVWLTVLAAIVLVSFGVTWAIDRHLQRRTFEREAVAVTGFLRKLRNGDPRAEAFAERQLRQIH